jgi:hypothetical protein
VSKVEKHPVAFGGFSDIWSCVLERSSYLSLRGDTTDDDFDELEMNGDPMVAVKAVRIHAGADEDGVRKCKVWLSRISTRPRHNPARTEVISRNGGLETAQTSEHSSAIWCHVWLWSLTRIGLPLDG